MPEIAGISKMYLRTSPSKSANGTKGFGLLSLSQYEISDMTDLSYQYQLVSPSAYQLALDIDLITEYQDGMACTSRMFSDLMYPEATTVEKRLTVPEGIQVDYSRYADIVVPEPTVEALIFAFAEYKGGHAPSLQEIDYSIWRIYPEQTIEAYSPELRLYLFGEGVDYGDWESAAHMLEILSVITPELDPRFARDVDEVTLPQFHMFCESWMVPEYKKHCNMKSNAAAFSNGPTRRYYDSHRGADSRGFLWFQSRIVTEPGEGKGEKIGDIATNPCCSINFHEFSHSVGLSHNYCPYSSVGRWEDRPYMTKPFSEDDLAGMAVHLDPRTEHGMTIEEAADALGIEKNERYYELVEKPWLACGEQHPTWEELANRVYEDHISSDLVETNNR